ncbi:hypothetical protein CCACVL1_02480 [Corchorus capsularis]|uniref:Uncharacterized protein n=1 Tax=Corchorus capsularis TaxID=210143 RepID=A0A1R3K888_COCAP|nr:hypothetical protein CCACVL1_02480 [Corchorus capsularis]
MSKDNQKQEVINKGLPRAGLTAS